VLTRNLRPVASRQDGRVTRRGWILFVAMSAIWGLPYLLIKEAVASMAPISVVAGRTGIGALVLFPIAVRRGALRPVLAHWRPLVAFTAIEMGGPFLLLSDAERVLPSGLSGLLVATVPLFGTVVAFALGDRLALRPLRIVGLLVGLGGVACIVGGHGSGTVRPWNVAEVLLVAVGYSIAPFIADRHLRDVPGLGLATASLGLVAVVYVPIALATQRTAPTGRSVAALIALALVCTAVAFVTFFALIEEAGPARATLITYVNPVIALSLGVVVLDESLTLGLLIGAPLVIAGCWLAASRRDPEPVLVAEP
jgi:drug/metabolite transporter (DMT)-like permease